MERLDDRTSVIHRRVSKTYRQLLELCIPFSLTVHIEHAVKSSQKTLNKLRNYSRLNRVSEYVLRAALSARRLNSSAVEWRSVSSSLCWMYQGPNMDGTDTAKARVHLGVAFDIKFAYRSNNQRHGWNS